MRYSAAFIVLLAGCGGEATPMVDTVEVDRPRPSTNSGSIHHRYTIHQQTVRDAPLLQQRLVTLILRDTQDRDTAKGVLREVYTSCKDSIESKNQPEARKFIQIRLFDSVDDVNDGLGLPLCIVESSIGAESNVPPFDQARIQWWWRDQNKRPNNTDTIIYREYHRRLRENRKHVEAPYYDSEGIMRTTREDAVIIERQLDALERDLAAELRDKHELTKEELATLLSRLSLWTSGSDVSEESVKNLAKTFLDDWR